MTLSSRFNFLFPALAVAVITHAAAEGSVPEDVFRSARSGPWSDPATWAGESVPGEGARVQIRTGHRVLYDVDSEAAIRAIHVAGELSFATDRDTRLDVGLIRIEAGEEWKDGGFNCHFEPEGPREGPLPALEIGMPNQRVGAEYRALIRLVSFEGDDTESLPAIVNCAGRMDIHGTPLGRTWVKLGETASVNDTRIFLAEDASDWKAGDRIVITSTQRQQPVGGSMTTHVTEAPSSEERIVQRVSGYSGSVLSQKLGNSYLELDQPLNIPHRASEGYAAEIANLSRNVIIESADPNGHRGHTMYHRYSRGSISYAEFR
ncbi:MAG: G8 domain-containing protein, partial [Verrucomicrobiota bacterium]